MSAKMSSVIHGGREFMITPDVYALIDKIGDEHSIPTPTLVVAFGECEKAHTKYTEETIKFLEQIESISRTHQIERTKLEDLFDQYVTAKADG